MSTSHVSTYKHVCMFFCRQLMAKEPLEKLGFKDLMDEAKDESREKS